MRQRADYPGSPVVPVLNRARTYRVVSLSRPDEYHIVDLAHDNCTCERCKYHPNETELCRPKQWALFFEAEQKEVQSKMPIVTSRLRREVTGAAAPPKVAGMTQEELRVIFS
jgi:hypothetical protein